MFDAFSSHFDKSGIKSPLFTVKSTCLRFKLPAHFSSKGQGPNGRAHRAEKLLLQHGATTELHKGHTEDVGEEQQQHQGEEPQAPE